MISFSVFSHFSPATWLADSMDRLKILTSLSIIEVLQTKQHGRDIAFVKKTGWPSSWDRQTQLLYKQALMSLLTWCTDFYKKIRKLLKFCLWESFFVAVYCCSSVSFSKKENVISIIKIMWNFKVWGVK